MAFYAENLGDLRKKALGMIDSSDDDNHFGSMVNQWINDAYRMFVGDGLEDYGTIVTTVGTMEYTLPTGFSKAKLIMYDNTPLRHVPLDDIDFYSTGTCYPDRYAIFSGTSSVTPKLFLGPLAPSEAKTVKIYYFREPEYLSSDSDEPELPMVFRFYLSHYASAQMFLVDGRTDLFQVHIQLFNSGLKKYTEDMKGQKERDTGDFVRTVY